MTDKQPKTFADLGLVFSTESGCVTCRGEDMSCHNNVTSKIDGLDYNLHISKNSSDTVFKVNATISPSVDSPSDSELVFTDEEEAVTHICKTYNGFKCF